MSEQAHGATVLRVIPAAFYLIVPLLCGPMMLFGGLLVMLEAPRSRGTGIVVLLWVRGNRDGDSRHQTAYRADRGDRTRDYVLRQCGRNLREFFLDAGPVHSVRAIGIDAFPNAEASYRGRPSARGGKGAREASFEVNLSGFASPLRMDQLWPPSEEVRATGYGDRGRQPWSSK
jgi:hypothetical protein